MQETEETQVQPLGWEDPLEKGMASLSSILACKIPWTEEPGGLPSLGHKESDMTEQAACIHMLMGVIKLFLSLFSLGLK